MRFPKAFSSGAAGSNSACWLQATSRAPVESLYCQAGHHLPAWRRACTQCNPSLVYLELPGSKRASGKSLVI